jgi:V/A-type H+-transporting ATPase subunit E
MNGIEKITDRIAVDTDREVKALLQEAQRQADEITASYQALAESDYREALKKGEADAAERVVRLEGVAQLEARKLRLATRQEVLDLAFQRALEKLLSLPEEEYVALLAKLAAQGATTGREALVLSIQDRPRYGKRVVTRANELLAAQGKTAALTLSEESREFRGGLYIQDGNIENNCTFPTILRILREQMAGEVAKLLFD